MTATKKKAATSRASDRELGATFSSSVAPRSTVLPCAGGMSKEACDVGSVYVTDAIGARTIVVKSKRPTGGYDFTYDVVADYKASKRKDPKPTIVTLRAGYLGRCPGRGHPDLRWYPEGQPTSACTDQEMRLIAPEQTGVLPLSWSALFDSSDPFFAYEVIATSCGTRAGGAANGALRGRVRVYRVERWEVTIALPPLREWKAEWKKSVHGKTTVSSEGKTFGVTTSERESTTTVGPGGVGLWRSEREGRAFGGGVYAYSGFEQNRDGSTRAFVGASASVGPAGIGVRRSSELSANWSDAGIDAELSDELEWKPGGECTVKRNEAEVDLLDLYKSIVNIVLAIKRSWNDVFDVVPQAGWKVTFDLSLLEGSITGTVERVLGGVQNGRDALLDRKTGLQVALKVFSVDVEASFGIEISSEGLIDALAQTKVFELVAKIALTVKGDLTLSGKLESGGSELKGEVVIAADLKALGSITIDGYSWAIEGKVEGGLSLEAVLSLSRSPLSAVGAATLQPVTFTITRTVPGSEEKKLFEKVLNEERELWSGSLLGP